MKIYGAAVLALACIPTVGAFVSTSSNIQKPIGTTTGLNLQVDKQTWVGPTTTVVVGLTLASQVVGAVPLETSSVFEPSIVPIMQQNTQQKMVLPLETSPVSSISGSSLQLAEKVDYLDFSLPSYSDTSTSSSIKKDSSGAPTFSNPFADFDPFASKPEDSSAPAAPTPAPVVVDTSAEDRASADAAKKAEKEAAAQKKEEEKATREAEKAARKAEKEAAIQKKAAEEAEEAVKKAEKEARLKAEKEKQRIAVERASEDKKTTAPSLNVETPSLPDSKAPDIKFPEFKAPDIKVPEFKVPDMKGPDIKVPDFKAPEFKVPDIKLDVPDFQRPDVKIPDISLPKFSMPKVDIPKVDAPSFSTPKTPSFDTPKVAAPIFSAPSFGGGKSGYQSLDAMNDVDSQEVRDERAKAASTAYKTADTSAKEVEAKAKDLRNIANEKKKVAKAAKDEACKTRIGGKILCIRPFGIGY